jgi:hypothetical protein
VPFPKPSEESSTMMKLKIGPGLRQEFDQVYVSKAGVLMNGPQPGKMWVEGSQHRVCTLYYAHPVECYCCLSMCTQMIVWKFKWLKRFSKDIYEESTLTPCCHTSLSFCHSMSPKQMNPSLESFDTNMERVIVSISDPHTAHLLEP